jgi:DNA-binding Lrp family transcriptional regulator
MNAAILEYLRENGEQMDVEIARALRISKAQIQDNISQLSSAGEVICCRVTRFLDGKKIEGISCRLSAYVPPRATGPKPGSKRGAASSTTPEETTL